MICANNLIKNYGDKAALRGISFKISRGEIFGLLGPNGAGKTTTIKILTGQLDSDEGQAEIMDRDVYTHRREINPLMGVVPEETNLYERLSVVQNLQFFCRLYSTGFEKIEEYLDLVDLLSEKNSAVKELSRGMKQKVLLIRALLHEPEVLFLDEPTSGLDPASADSIHRILKNLNQEGITILLTSHNMEEVDKMCGRVAFLDRGELAAVDTPESLKLTHSSSEMRVLIKTEDGYEEKVLDMNSEETARKLSEWIKEKRLAAVHSCEPSLADIFVKLTGRDLT